MLVIGIVVNYDDDNDGDGDGDDEDDDDDDDDDEDDDDDDAVCLLLSENHSTCKLPLRIILSPSVSAMLLPK